MSGSSIPLIYQRKYIGPNTEPCGTPNAMFDIEELKFLNYKYVHISRIGLKPTVHALQARSSAVEKVKKKKKKCILGDQSPPMILESH